MGEEKVLIIPIGMFCGIVFIGIMRETALELSPSIEVLSCLFPFHGVLEQRLSAHLGSIGIIGNLALQSMYTLSGLFFFLDNP
jgi:hypothetical protein